MTHNQYWRAYARQNAMYERYGAYLFRVAIRKSIAPVLVSLNPADLDNRPIYQAFEKYYLYVGKKHKEWEDKQWERKFPGSQAIRGKNGSEDLSLKEDERESPRHSRARAREEVGLFARIRLSFSNAMWLRRLKDMINGLDTASRVTGITETVRKRIQKILSEASQEEIQTRRIAARLRREVGIEMTPARAKMIARTETTRVTNEAAKHSALELGIDLDKFWIATLDDKTRDAHREMNNQKPIGANEKFLVGGRLMDKPGDPAGGAANCINCRCVVAYIPKGGRRL